MENIYQLELAVSRAHAIYVSAFNASGSIASPEVQDARIRFLHSKKRFDREASKIARNNRKTIVPASYDTAKLFESSKRLT